MKKLIILLLITIVVSSCNQQCEEQTATINGINIYTYTFDGCEYIGSIKGTYQDKLTHKGNCKYCIERNKK